MAKLFGTVYLEEILFNSLPVDIIFDYDEEGIVIKEVITPEGTNIINNLSHSYLMELVSDYVDNADYHPADHGD